MRGRRGDRDFLCHVAEIQMSSVGLVPGDVIIVQPECIMECDAVLMSGSCVVNESMLTGTYFPSSFLRCVHTPKRFLL